MRKFLLLFIAIVSFSITSFGQSFSNQGKDFWVGYGYHQVMTGGNSQDMVLYFATNELTSVTVSIPGLGYTQTYPNIAANTIFTTPILPKAGATDARLLTSGLSSKGIHIESTKPIVAYAHIYNASVSGACVLLPTNTLGKEYFSINYTNNSNSPNSNSWFYVVAADTGTTVVEIEPSGTTTNGWAAGSSNTITLTQGQIYNVMGATILNTGCGGNAQPPCTTFDLTGSKIKSIATGNGGCKKIAVFSGSGRISLTCNNTPSSSDNYMVQAFPKAAWGKRFLTATTGGNMTRNIYRVCVSDPAAIVRINGAVTALPLIGNFYYEIPFTTLPQKIESDLPITVAQYVTSQNACSNTNPGDPEVIYLSPVEQSISNVLFNSNLLVAANPSHFANVIIPNGGTALTSFKRDGVNIPPASFIVHPQDPAYSYIKIAGLTLGGHRLESDSGFNAIAYGFAAAESYGYNAGTNVRNFNQELFTPSQYGILNDGTSYACLNTPFRFNIFLPDSAISNTGPSAGTNLAIRFDSMRWQVTSPTNFTPNNFPVMVYGTPKVPFDSLTIRNGKPVAWYSLPTQYSINAPGTYNITVTGFRTNATSDGCTSGNETDFDFTLVVPNAPTATFTNTIPGCPNDPVQFTETNPQTPAASATYIFNWNFGDPASGAANNISTVRNPMHTFSGPGTYTVSFSNITAAGCISAVTTQQVIVTDLANATISGTTAVCQNAPQPNINFTIINGAAPYTINYTLATNGGAPVPQTPIITSTLANTLPVPTNTAGTFLYNITSIENANPAFCIRNITGQTATVTVNPLPTATILGTATVCQNAATQIVTITGSNATAPYKFTYTLNGVTQPILTSNAAGVATISVPTTSALVNIYELVSVQDGSTTACTQAVTGQAATVTVQANPTATIASTASAVCQDGNAPTLTLTASGGVAPYRFTYTVTTNGTTSAPIVVTSATNTHVITVPLTTVGTLVYNITTIENLTPITCPITLSGVSTTVNVNPVPTATISGTTTACQAAGTQFVTLTGIGGTRPYTFTYRLNAIGTLFTVQSDLGVDTKVIAVPNAVGTYFYEITKVQDATATACSTTYTSADPSDFGPSAVVTIQATSTATIAGSTTVCQNSPAPTVTITGANGAAPFEYVYTITTNGVTGAPITASSTAPSLNLPIVVPMATVGTLVYTLISVKNTGSINCTTPITGQTATIVINPVPTATIGTTTTVCQNSPIVPVTLNGAGGTSASYIFTYSVNGGATQTAGPGNNIVVNQGTTIANSFSYKILSVRDAATNCVRNYTVAAAPTAIVTVNQLATATIATTAATVCQSSPSPTITFTATGGVAPFRFNYTITTNAVTGAVQTTPFTSFGSTYTLPAPTSTAGTYVYTLVSVQESSVVNCVNPQTSSTQVIVHPKPTASYAAAAPFCAQNAITITPSFGITPTGSVVSWVWNYGDGTGQQIRTNGNVFTLTYPTAGVKPVSFKVVSDKGCESDLATTPVVSINSKPKAGFINPEACLADAFAQFTDTSTVIVGGPIVNWEWEFNDGTPILSGGTPAIQSPLHAFATVGLKTVRLIVTTASGCKDTTTQTFFINGEVTSADFLPQGTFCSNRPVKIKENSVVNVGGLIRVDIIWDNTAAPTVVETDDLPTPGKIYLHSYPNLQVDRTYSVRYIAYSGFNGVCQKETTKNIVVRASPVASFAPPIQVCLNGGSVQLAGSEIGGVGGTSTYIGTGVSTTGLFNPLTATPGTYNITYTAISPNGCDSALVRPIKVLIPPVANFTTVGNLCVGGPGNVNVVTFSQSSTVTAGQGGAIVKWIYDWGDGSPVQTFTTGANVTHSYATSGVKTAHLIVEDAFGCRNAAPGKALNFTVNPLPVPDYTFTASACLPNANIVFTNNTPNLAANSYNWSFELPSTAAVNVSTASTATTSHIYTVLGPHNTKLIATNIATGCKDSLSLVVNTIHPAPVVAFAPMADICLNNGTRTLTQGSETSGIAGGPGVYSGPGVSASGVFNPITAGVGTHTITYSWTSTFNCTTTITGTIKVLAPPVVNTFTTVGNVCERNDIAFANTTTSTAGTITSWVYNWGDGSAAQTNTTGANTTHQYVVSGANTATLSLITDYGCVSSPPPFALQVNVNPIPRPNFTYSDTACLPVASVLFKNVTPSIGNWIYNWNFDVPSTNTADLSTAVSNITHLYYTQAPHTVRLIATSLTTGCKDSVFKPIVTIHPAPLASFTFTKPSVCIGDFVGVTDQSTFADGTPNKWEWKWGDGATSVNANPGTHTYTTATTFNVSLKITNNWGCIDDTMQPFTVHPFPVVDAGRDSIILQGGNLTLTPTVTGNDLTYLWTGTPGPINLNSNVVKNPVASPLEDITYKLTVTARGGCSASDFVFIKVLKDPVVPNTFTPNNDGVHDTWIIKYLESYPDNRIQVFTRAGQLVFESRRYLKPWDGTVNGKSLPIDTYYYILEPGNGRKPLTGFVTIIK